MRCPDPLRPESQRQFMSPLRDGHVKPTQHPVLPTPAFYGVQSVIIRTCCMELCQIYDAQNEAVCDLLAAGGLKPAGGMQPLWRMLQTSLSLPFPALRRRWTQHLCRLRLQAAELPEIPAYLGGESDQAQLRLLLCQRRRSTQQSPPRACAGRPRDHLTPSSKDIYRAKEGTSELALPNPSSGLCLS
jgi:hypothetical protein